jgi:hypothetical protein
MSTLFRHESSFTGRFADGRKKEQKSVPACTGLAPQLHRAISGANGPVLWRRSRAV